MPGRRKDLKYLKVIGLEKSILFNLWRQSFITLSLNIFLSEFFPTIFRAKPKLWTPEVVSFPWNLDQQGSLAGLLQAVLPEALISSTLAPMQLLHQVGPGLPGWVNEAGLNLQVFILIYTSSVLVHLLKALKNNLQWCLGLNYVPSTPNFMYKS